MNGLQNNSLDKKLQQEIGILRQRIAQAHNGYLTLESELGEGSCFTVWLPVEVG